MSFEQLVDLARPHMPPTLVSSENLEQIKRVASHLPSRVARYFGFETKLLSDQARCDFAFSLSNDGVAWMAGTDSPWPRIRQFCTLWGESEESPCAAGNAVWLEYDVSDWRSAELEPSLFFALRDPQSYLLPISGKSNRSMGWICHTLIPAAWGHMVSSSIEQNLLHTLELCPDGVDFLQIGLMLSRDMQQALRLCLFRIPPQEVFPFLHSVGWPGNESKLTQILECYTPFVDALCLHLDIGESVFPTLGVEMLYNSVKDPWDRQPRREARWKLFFDRLVDDGLCLPSKRDALLNWPSRTTFRLPLIEKLIAAATLDQTSYVTSALLDGVLVTGLQHVKFSLSSTGSIIAKAYFGARYDQDMQVQL